MNEKFMANEPLMYNTKERLMSRNVKINFEK